MSKVVCNFFCFLKQFALRTMAFQMKLRHKKLPSAPSTEKEAKKVKKVIDSTLDFVCDETLEELIEMAATEFPECDTCLLEGGMFTLSCGHRMCIACHGGELDGEIFEQRASICGMCRTAYESSEADAFVARYCRKKCPNEGTFVHND